MRAKKSPKENQQEDEI